MFFPAEGVVVPEEKDVGGAVMRGINVWILLVCHGCVVEGLVER